VDHETPEPEVIEGPMGKVEIDISFGKMEVTVFSSLISCNPFRKR
jgi:hypothetical protein